MRNIFFIALLVFVLFVAPGPAQDFDGRSIMVFGQSEKQVDPDIITISVLITESEKNLEKAKELYNLQLARFREVCTLFDLPDENLEAKGMQISPIYEKWGDEKSIEGYRAQQMVLIKLDSMAQYEPLIEALIGAGVEHIGSLSYRYSKEAEALIEVQEMALRNAREKAARMAAVFGMDVGKPLKISEVDLKPVSGTFDLEYGSSDNLRIAGQLPVPPIPGKERIGYRVMVEFELLEY